MPQPHTHVSFSLRFGPDGKNEKILFSIALERRAHAHWRCDEPKWKIDATIHLSHLHVGIDLCSCVCVCALCVITLYVIGCAIWCRRLICEHTYKISLAISRPIAPNGRAVASAMANVFGTMTNCKCMHTADRKANRSTHTHTPARQQAASSRSLRKCQSVYHCISNVCWNT